MLNFHRIVVSNTAGYTKKSTVVAMFAVCSLHKGLVRSEIWLTRLLVLYRWEMLPAISSVGHSSIRNVISLTENPP